MVAAKSAGDEKTQAWLQWALEEQVEEEDLARKLVNAAVVAGNRWAEIDLLYAE